MSKLAGRMTYLAFGVLAGITASVALFSYFAFETTSSQVVQMWAAAITALTSALSAYAAYQAASIARIAHTSAKGTTKVRIDGAKRVIRNFYTDLVESRKESDEEIFRDRSTITFSEPAKLISVAIGEPIGHEQYLALWRAIHVFQSIQRLLEENGYVDTKNGDAAIRVIREVMNTLEIDLPD